MQTVTDFYFLEFQNHANMKLKDTCFLEENYDKPREHMKKQRHHFEDKCSLSQNSGFSSHVKMWSWTIKKAES